MLFYWTIFCILFLIAYNAPRGRKDKLWIISFLMLLILGATRAKTVGNDLNGGYWTEYTMMHEDPKTWGRAMYQFEIGFQWIMANFKTYLDFFNNPIHFFHTLFAVTFSLFTFYIKKECKYVAFSLFFMFAFGYYFSLYNTMRQNFCISIILLWFVFFLKRDGKKYIALLSVLICITAFLFHKSQLVLLLAIPIYIYYKKIPNWLLYSILIVSSLTSMWLAQFAFSQMGEIAFLFDDGSSNFAGYLTSDVNIGNYSTISNVLNTIYCLYCVYCCKKKTSFYLTLYVFGVVLLNILTPISWIFMRIANEFMFFRIILYANLWHQIPNKTERVLFRISIIVLSIVMFNNRLINDNFQDVVPYINYYLSF